jgi:hypothetical protein
MSATVLNNFSGITIAYRLMVNVVGVVLSLAVSTGLAAAQSKDKNNPTKLTSPEIAGSTDSKSKESYYYTFMAGPGELIINIQVRLSKPNPNPLEHRSSIRSRVIT